MKFVFLTYTFGFDYINLPKDRFKMIFQHPMLKAKIPDIISKFHNWNYYSYNIHATSMLVVLITSVNRLQND